MRGLRRDPSAGRHRRLLRRLEVVALSLLAAHAFGACAREPASPDPDALALIETLDLRADTVASRDRPGWAPPRHVVVATADPEVIRRLGDVVPDATVEPLQPAPARAAQLRSADVLIGSCDGDAIAAAPDLQWIQTWWVGVERCVAVPGLAGRGIVLTNTQRTSSIPIAEHAVAMMLSLARGLPAYGRAQQAGQWVRDDGAPAPRELTGATVLVVGLGGIGTEIARRADGLGMRVIATRNSRRDGPPFVDRVGLPDELLSLAAEADVVVNAAPLTAETTGLFDRGFFAALKPGSVFINVARGRSVVTDALVDALRSGRLAGAALDVTDPEPLPAGHPLWAMGNVIITPHVASDSSAQEERYLLLVAENLRRYAAGEPLLNVVDIERGY